MAQTPPKNRNQRQIQNSIFSVGLSLATLLLFIAVGYTSVTRAFDSAEFPPTATIPADLGANLAQVSDLAGNVQRQPAGESERQPVRVGNTIAAGDGSMINVVGLGYVNLSLANRAVLYLDDDSELELKSIEGETIGVLNFGRMLLNNPQRTLDFTFSAPSGAQFTATGRTLAGINFDPSDQRFAVDCLSGTCDLTGGDGVTLRLSAGQRGEVLGSGPAEVAGDARIELYQSLGARGIVPTPTRQRATAAPTQVPATATFAPPSPTITPTIAAQPTLTPTLTGEPTVTATISADPTITPTISAETATPTSAATPSPDVTEPAPPAPTETPDSPTETPAPDPTKTPAPEPTVTDEPAPTETIIPDPTETPPPDPTPTDEPTPTEGATSEPTASPTSDATNTPPAPTATSEG